MSFQLLRQRRQSRHFRQQVPEFLLELPPVPAASLTPPAKLPQPHAQHFVPECFQSILVTRYGVVIENALSTLAPIPSNHRLQPLHRVFGRVVQTHPQLPPNFLQLRRHALAHCLPRRHEVPGLMILPTSVSEPQKVKGFRLLFPRLARRSAAYRPNSIRRVLSGCKSNPTARELKAHYFRTRPCNAASNFSASSLYWNPWYKS